MAEDGSGNLIGDIASGAVVGNLSTEKAIRDALREAPSADDGVDSSSLSVGDTSMRISDVEDIAGGSSRLGKAAVGTAALSAALTLQ